MNPQGNGGELPEDHGGDGVGFHQQLPLPEWPAATGL